MLLNFVNQDIITALLAFFFLWLLFLTFFLIKTVRHYQRLVGTTKKHNLKKILEQMLETSKKQEEQTSKIVQRCDNIEKKSSNYFQKVGFLRFNPFSDTGGDQSFVLSLLDGKDSGIILNSLHSRGTTRLYAKEVKKGSGEKTKLSKEEKEVIKKANRRKV